jgi:hypothetical protein
LEKVLKLESAQPRLLRYRSHYKIYWLSLLVFSGIILSFWGHRWLTKGELLFKDYQFEMWFSGFYFLAFGAFYLFYLQKRLHRSVQVYTDRIVVHHGKEKEDFAFSEIESVRMVCWSLFYFKLKNGLKFYFSSSIERVDYIWEGFHQARPELLNKEEYEAFRIKLVQYDHHQKRREWFFRHRLIDICNWIILPLSFIGMTYVIQSKDIVIHQQGLYFFRLFMYSILVLLISTFVFSIVLKRFVFDKRIKIQLEDKPQDKIRDLEFEGIVLQQSKLLQMIMASFVFFLVVKSDLNLYSVTKIKDDFANFNLKKGSTVIVDNRYNCTSCKYQIHEGDVVIFGRGYIGQIIAHQGETIGKISRNTVGRMIASEDIHTVPQGHVAVKLGEKAAPMMIKLNDVIGRVQK